MITTGLSSIVFKKNNNTPKVTKFLLEMWYFHLINFKLFLFLSPKTEKLSL